MKRYLIALALVLAASVSLSAATLSFSQGAAFIAVAHSGWPVTVGSSTQIMWYADDLGYGIKREAAQLTQYDDMGNGSRWRQQQLNEVIIQKWLSKSVAIGLGFGTNGITTNYKQRMDSVIEINGAIQILSGKGEKINASLDFGIARRWVGLKDDFDFGPNQQDMNQTVSTLAVTIGL